MLHLAAGQNTAYEGKVDQMTLALTPQVAAMLKTAKETTCWAMQPHAVDKTSNNIGNPIDGWKLQKHAT